MSILPKQKRPDVSAAKKPTSIKKKRRAIIEEEDEDEKNKPILNKMQDEVKVL